MKSKSGLVSFRSLLSSKIANISQGTCTDVHDNVQTKIAAAQTREQLLGVLKHGKVTLLTVDTERRVTLLEGSLIWDKAEELSKTNRWLIGQNMYAVFNRLTEQLPEGERPEFLQPIEDILDGKILEGVCEHRIGGSGYCHSLKLADRPQMTSGTAHGLYPTTLRACYPHRTQLLV